MYGREIFPFKPFSWGSAEKRVIGIDERGPARLVTELVPAKRWAVKNRSHASIFYRPFFCRLKILPVTKENEDHSAMLRMDANCALPRPYWPEVAFLIAFIFSRSPPSPS